MKGCDFLGALERYELNSRLYLQIVEISLKSVKELGQKIIQQWSKSPSPSRLVVLFVAFWWNFYCRIR